MIEEMSMEASSDVVQSPTRLYRRELPGAVDEMTPHGRLPTDDEASRWV